MSMKLKAELVMAVRDYECKERESWDEGTDFTASAADSDEKILLRVISEPKSKSDAVGVDVVRQMVETMKEKRYDRGVLITNRFTESAKREMKQKKIEMVSENYMPPFEPQKLYLAIQDGIDDLCKTKCGVVPEKEADCRGRNPDGDYSCDVRLISDNALFHFKRGWIRLLRKDLMRLLALQKLFGLKRPKARVP